MTMISWVAAIQKESHLLNFLKERRIELGKISIYLKEYSPCHPSYQKLTVVPLPIIVYPWFYDLQKVKKKISCNKVLFHFLTGAL